MVAADGWANSPTACLWEDHFAYTSDRSKLEGQMTAVADGKSFKNAVRAGLKLSPAGLALINKAESTKVTTDYTAHPDHEVNNLWDVDSSAAAGKKFDYELGAKGPVGPGGATDKPATPAPNVH
jgi:hypothetical protein